MGDCACDVHVDHLDPATPLTLVFLELTSQCNNACPGCGSAHAHPDVASSPSAADWRTLVDQLPTRDLRLRLTGGEPTLHPEFAEILAYLDNQGIPFTIFTNSRWANPDATIQLLATKRHLEGILVSVHGAEASIHEAFTAVLGSFEEAVTNTRQAAEAGIRVVTSSVITHQNYEQMEKIVALARSIGADRATFSRFIGPPLPGIEASEGELKTAVQTIERLMTNGDNLNPQHETIRYGAPIPHCFVDNRSNGCMAGFVHATIDPWGNVRPCPHVPTIVGNLFEQSFEEVWGSPVMALWRDGLLAQCDGCLLVSECRSGCLAQASWRGTKKDPLIRFPVPEETGTPSSWVSKYPVMPLQAADHKTG